MAFMCLHVSSSLWAFFMWVVGGRWWLTVGGTGRWAVGVAWQVACSTDTGQTSSRQQSPYTYPSKICVDLLCNNVLGKQLQLYSKKPTCLCTFVCNELSTRHIG